MSRIESRSEIAWGLRGLTAKGHEDILGDDEIFLSLQNCGLSYKTVYFCWAHQTVFSKGWDMIVYKSYLSR